MGQRDIRRLLVIGATAVIRWASRRGAPAGFEAGGFSACPPVVEYSREFQERAAEELALLPEGTAIAEMMGDYTVMRQQARLCQ